MEHRYEHVFAALDEAGVDFVVVGGLAVVAHGHARLTVAAALVEIAGREVRVASVDHLVQMKVDAGRPRDTADVAALRALQEGGS